MPDDKGRIRTKSEILFCRGSRNQPCDAAGGALFCAGHFHVALASIVQKNN